MNAIIEGGKATGITLRCDGHIKHFDTEVGGFSIDWSVFENGMLAIYTDGAVTCFASGQWGSFTVDVYKLGMGPRESPKAPRVSADQMGVRGNAQRSTT